MVTAVNQDALNSNSTPDRSLTLVTQCLDISLSLVDSPEWKSQGNGGLIRPASPVGRCDQVCMPIRSSNHIHPDGRRSSVLVSGQSARFANDSDSRASIGLACLAKELITEKAIMAPW